MSHETDFPLAEDQAAQPYSKKRTKNLGQVAAHYRQRAPEAHQLHSPQEAPEHIGHMLVNAESTATSGAPEKSDKKRPNQIAVQLGQQRVETLSRVELLSLSEQIVIDGSSLGQIYETHLIGERGLRRLVAEYARGGDVKKALRQEILERAIDFERDPALRDMKPQSQESLQSTGGTALSKLLEKVGIDPADDSEQAAFLKARDDYHAQQAGQAPKRHPLADFSLVVVIALLLVVIIVLYLRQK